MSFCLEQFAEQFWARYKLSLMPEEPPGDALASRMHKKLARRQLTVRDVWQTWSLAHQLKSERRKCKLGDANFSLVEEDVSADVEVPRNVVIYLPLLVQPVPGICAGS